MPGLPNTDPPIDEQPTVSFGIRSGLVLAATYVIAGKLGLMLAIAPGYASGIFPPAGLAIAATYLWGRSTIPWIFLGSLTLNFLLANAHLDHSTALAAISIASASTLQAWLGRSVLNRTIGTNAGLDTVRQIVGYALPAPAICLVSASVSVGSLVLLGLIQPDRTLFAWVTWAIGDTLGMVSIFPIMLALFGTPDSIWKGRRLVVVSAMSTSLALGICIYIRFTEIESAELARTFHFQADRVANNVQVHFDEQEFILHQLAVTLSLSHRERVSREVFEALARPALSRFPMLQAIEWAPEIPLSRRAVFEASQRQSVPEFVISQRNNEGEVVAALDRPTYYPVTYIEPLAGNRKALGFDLGSNPTRKAAVLRALRSDGSIATEPVRLIQEQDAQSSILLIRHVRTGANAPGFVLTVLRVNDFIGKLLPDGEQMTVSLTDAERGEVIYGTPPTPSTPTGFTRTLRFGGRHYQLSISPSLGFVAAHPNWHNWNLLVSGILGNGLLGAILLLVTGTTNQIRVQVEERTQQLALKSNLLWDSEERFRRLFDFSPDPVWIIDNHQVVECNQAAVEMLGYPDKESLKNTHPSALSPDYQPDGARSYQKAEHMMTIAQEKGIHRFEWVHTRKDGTNFLAEVTLSTFLLQGRPVIHGLWRDITARKEAEDALRKSEQSLTEAQHMARLGSWELNIPNNRLTWSDETYRIFEIDPAHFGGGYNDFLNAIHPQDRESVNTAYANSLKTRQHYAIQHRLCMPDGRIKHIYERCYTVFDEAGQPLRSIGTAQDITEQMLRDEELRASKERFDLAMQAASDGLWDWNIQTQVTYLSPQWKAMLGYADHELDNSFATWERLVDEDGRVWTIALINDCLCGRSQGFKTEFQMRHKDGHWVDILSRAMIVRAPNGEPLRMVGTHVDITERNAIARELEQAAQTLEQQNQALIDAHKQALAATEAKSAFLASMSHEIRTPLNAIIGMADLLRETSLSPDQTDYVRRFNRAANHLMDLLNSILDLSKIEASELQLEQIPFNPRELSTTVGDLMEVNAQAKQLALAVHIRPDVPSTVIGDPTRLRQVLMNLVGNAIKFTEQGQVVVTVEAVADDRVRFTVSDTGIGIPSDKLPFIFESFTQGDATTTRKFGGTGLGLAICKRLVDMMDGHLMVTSALGVGSTFEFTLRLPSAIETVPPRSNSHVQRGTELPARPSAPPLRILVVDDLEDNRVIVAHYLKNSVYVIETADNGQIAVEKFQTGRYDLVLMDVQMPLMDGLEATRAMREWERTQHRAPTPILALTAHALAEEAKKSLDAGCTAHLTKPIRKHVLLKAIADYAAPRTEQAA